jgi:hypothetical protein
MQPWSFTVASILRPSTDLQHRRLYLRPDYREGKRFLLNRNVKPGHIAPLTVPPRRAIHPHRDEERTWLCLSSRIMADSEVMLQVEAQGSAITP